MRPLLYIVEVLWWTFLCLAQGQVEPIPTHPCQLYTVSSPPTDSEAEVLAANILLYQPEPQDQISNPL